MRNRKKLAVIIPAYNEQESIANVIDSINNVSYTNIDITAIVINDCSNDNTKAIINKLECVALNLPVNLGIGGAVQTGYRYAKENNFDYCIQVDGDGQHPSSEIPKLLDEIMKGTHDLVIGSRFIDKQGFQSSGMRRLGIGFLRNWIKLFAGITIYDNTSGFRLVNKKLIDLFSKSYPDEYPEPESLIMVSKKGYKISEVAVLMQERQGGESSIRAFDQLYYMAKVSLAIIYTFIRTKK